MGGWAYYCTECKYYSKKKSKGREYNYCKFEEMTMNGRFPSKWFIDYICKGPRR